MNDYLDLSLPDFESDSAEPDYGLMGLLKNFSDATARLTDNCIYIIDYHRHKFIYVSDNPLFLLGKSAKEIQTLGFDYYFQFVPKEDYPILRDINTAGFYFFKNIPENERTDWLISSTFHIASGNSQILIDHKTTALTFTPNGKIWLGLCMVSVADRSKNGVIEMRNTRTGEIWNYDRVDKIWRKIPHIFLTQSERHVIILTIQGYTIKEIAERLFLSVDTIKKYRNHIFEKLNVKNINEAVTACHNRKLI